MDVAPRNVTLWVGLEDRGPERRRASQVCIQVFGYAVGDGTLSVQQNRTSPHACRADEAFSLVLRGETAYLPMTMELPALWDESTTVRLRIVLRERRAERKVVDAEVEWRGSMGQLLQEGRHLL